MPGRLVIRWSIHPEGYAIVGRDQGLAGYLTDRVCPEFCEDAVSGNLIYVDNSWDYTHGFDIFSHDYEGRRDDEDKALNVAHCLILDFLRQHVSDIRGGGGFEVLFRRACVALGLTKLWLALVPFRYHRIHLSAAKRAAEDAERAAEDAERTLGASHWTADTVGDWVVCAAGAAHSPRVEVDLIVISAPENYEDALRGIGPELEATLCRGMRLRFYRRQRASMPIRCEIEGCPDVDRDEVCDAIRAAVDGRIPAPHSHEFDFCFCEPDRLAETDAEEAVRAMRRARHRQRREAARAAAADAARAATP